jgi:hypothetical protein
LHLYIHKEWGWRIFTAIEEYAWVGSGGFSGIDNVREAESPRRRDRMETFVLSETRRSSKEFLISLSKYVVFDFWLYMVFGRIWQHGQYSYGVWQ